MSAKDAIATPIGRQRSELCSTRWIDFGRFTISRVLVVANLVFSGGVVVTSVGHRTNGRLPNQR